ncbi:hypothetical protein DVH05_008705 [Phytophthora capsici]|nr:hypothetical protein DVH05_008705 [Phytophthora capsici]
MQTADPVVELLERHTPSSLRAPQQETRQAQQKVADTRRGRAAMLYAARGAPSRRKKDFRTTRAIGALIQPATEAWSEASGTS